MRALAELPAVPRVRGLPQPGGISLAPPQRNRSGFSTSAATALASIPGVITPQTPAPTNHPHCSPEGPSHRWGGPIPGCARAGQDPGLAGRTRTFLGGHAGQGVVFAALARVSRRRGEGGAEHGPRLVLLVALLGELSCLGREEVEKGHVAVAADAVGEDGPFVHAQALPNDPALHQGVEAVLLEDLNGPRGLRDRWGGSEELLRKGREAGGRVQLPIAAPGA